MAAPRPLGITLLGSVVVVVGLILLVLGLVNILAFFGIVAIEISSDASAEAFLLSAFLNLFVGVALLASGNGLLNLRPWAWWLAFIVVLIGVFRSVFSLVTGVAQTALTALVSAVLGLILLLVLLGYLVSVRRYFRPARL